MVKFARWFRGTLLGVLFFGIGAAFVQACFWAVKEISGSAVRDWLAGKLGGLTGIEEADVLATGAIPGLPGAGFRDSHLRDGARDEARDEEGACAYAGPSFPPLRFGIRRGLAQAL